MSDPYERLQALIAAYNSQPELYATNAQLGMFMANYRQTVAEAPQFLVRAFRLAPNEEEKRRVLDSLVLAYDNTGEEESGFQVALSLYRSFPANSDYAESYARRCDLRGRFEEASRIYDALIRRGDAAAEKIKRQSGAARGIQLITDSSELLYAFGELGERIDTYLKAREFGLYPDVQAIIDGTRLEDRIANRFLFDCWAGQFPEALRLVEDKEEMAELRRVHGAARLQPTMFRLPDGRALYRNSAQTYIQRRWEEEGRAPLLQLPPGIVDKGQRWLAGLGLPEDGWFVCLHVRDGSFRFEPEDGLNRFRNARADKYLPVIEEITRRGGWVVRLGNAAEKPLPSMTGVIDLAGIEEREEWQDVFLLATCRFFLGTNSGPSAVAETFGRSVLAVDYFPFGDARYTRRCITLHKLLRRKADGHYLSVAEAVAPPLAWAQSPTIYERAGIEVIDNDIEDVLAALDEMFALVEGRLTLSAEDQERQLGYQRQYRIAQCGLGTIISPHFLAKYPFLTQ